jgi:hypothetical protein
MSAQDPVFLIFKDGEYFGTARDYEAAYRDVEDNVDRGAEDSAVQYDRFSIHEFINCGECPKPRPR